MTTLQTTVDLSISLRKALSADLDTAVQRAAERVAKDIQERIAPYPPERSGQVYIRGYGYPGGPKTSQNLGSRWSVRKQRSGAILSNSATYAPAVQSVEQQQRIHKGRWTTDKMAVEESLATGAVHAIVLRSVKEAL
jgi:hypothetical protein